MCLTPQHSVADVLVAVSLNGQQYTRSDGALYTELPGVGGERFTAVHLLRGLRYTFYGPPALLALAPRVGPNAGGALLRVYGRSFRGQVLNGGAAQAKCLLSCKSQANDGLVKSRNLVVDATLVGNEEARCVAPRVSIAACMLRLSLNGGADWHAAASHGSRFATLAAHALPVDTDSASACPTRIMAAAVAAAKVDDLSYVSRCTADNVRAACLADLACGAQPSGGCSPCVADDIGQPTCADGPKPPRICREWTYVMAIPDLSSLTTEVAGKGTGTADGLLCAPARPRDVACQCPRARWHKRPTLRQARLHARG